MRHGESPDLAEKLHFTPDEYAGLMELADQDGVSVEELIARSVRAELLARFGGEQRRNGNVIPFERP